MPDHQTQLLRSIMESLVRIEAKQDTILAALAGDPTEDARDSTPLEPGDPK